MSTKGGTGDYIGQQHRHQDRSARAGEGVWGLAPAERRGRQACLSAAAALPLPRRPPAPPLPCPEGGTRPPAPRCGEPADAPRRPRSLLGAPLPNFPLPSRPGEARRARPPPATAIGAVLPGQRAECLRPARGVRYGARHGTGHGTARHGARPLPLAHSPERLSPPWRGPSKVWRRRRPPPAGGGGAGRGGTGRPGPAAPGKGPAAPPAGLRRLTLSLFPSFPSPQTAFWSGVKGLTVPLLRRTAETLGYEHPGLHRCAVPPS